MTRRPVPLAAAASACALAAATLLAAGAARADNSDCLGCHDDDSLKSRDGRSVGVNGKALSGSAHASVSCTSCHDQPGKFTKAPHFPMVRPVNCAKCHGDAVGSFTESFHGKAREHGNPNAPTCNTCHRPSADPHGIQALTKRTAEEACRKCHGEEAKVYDTSVHAEAAKAGKGSPGCTGCHDTHSAALPPSAGAVNKLCEKCHPNAMTQVMAGSHQKAQEKLGAMSCVSCHDKHATHKPRQDEHTLDACQNCHKGYADQFKGSVHEDSFANGEMTCLSCHRTHKIQDAKEAESYACGRCHSEAEEQYRKSAHRLARLRGNKVAATCGSCHGGHHVVPPASPESPVNRKHVPETCGKCHTDAAVITSDFVRLPISLPSYFDSVHGKGWKAGKPTAVCTDCHGTHDLEASSLPTSSINKANLAQTCGKCHTKISQEYMTSVHGRAVAHGIHDSPSCTDCHSEHLILPVKDPNSPVRPENLSTVTCAKCHENPGMAARYGLPPEVIKSYRDSYHGWAIARGGKAVAVCTDCHNTHAIGSLLDPASPIHKSNVVRTCGKCHADSNAEFAASYTHVLARGRLMAHDWVRLFYLWLISLVLGGMLAHNALIYAHELRAHYRKKKAEPSVRRMTRAGVFQHAVFLVAFFGLAISGFALRFPDSWWAHALSAIGLNEELRRIFHRVMAITMVTVSVFHVFHVALTRRGRVMAKAMFPGLGDAKDALANVLYYVGLRKEKPTFGMFDYTQKAEYWALIWGTIVMALTGFVLWFPTQATSLLPAWTVRVAEVIHYYEAILAVSAIFVWHFFFVIVKSEAYPMSWTWVTGKMPLEEWDHHHARAKAQVGDTVELLPAPAPAVAGGGGGGGTGSGEGPGAAGGGDPKPA